MKTSLEMRVNGPIRLHLAVMNNDIARVRELITASVNVDARVVDGGPTALHLAIRDASIEVIRALLEAGARVDIVDRTRGTVTDMVICKSGYLPTAPNRADEILELFKELRSEAVMEWWVAKGRGSGSGGA